MEKYEVIGLQRKKGEYNGQRYDNWVLSVVRPADVAKEEVGSICSSIKIKFSDLPTPPVVGDTVSPVYDRFGRVVGLM